MVGQVALAIPGTNGRQYIVPLSTNDNSQATQAQGSLTLRIPVGAIQQQPSPQVLVVPQQQQPQEESIFSGLGKLANLAITGSGLLFAGAIASTLWNGGSKASHEHNMETAKAKLHEINGENGSNESKSVFSQLKDQGKDLWVQVSDGANRFFVKADGFLNNNGGTATATVPPGEKPADPKKTKALEETIKQKQPDAIGLEKRRIALVYDSLEKNKPLNEKSEASVGSKADIYESLLKIYGSEEKIPKKFSTWKEDNALNNGHFILLGYSSTKEKDFSGIVLQAGKNPEADDKLASSFNKLLKEAKNKSGDQPLSSKEIMKEVSQGLNAAKYTAVSV